MRRPYCTLILLLICGLLFAPSASAGLVGGVTSPVDGSRLLLTDDTQLCRATPGRRDAYAADREMTMRGFGCWWCEDDEVRIEWFGVGLRTWAIASVRWFTPPPECAGARTPSERTS